MKYLLKDGNTNILIDKDDLVRVDSFPVEWKIINDEGNKYIGAYVVTKGKSSKIKLSSFIKEVDSNKDIIHLNGNKYDFRKDNLKVVK